MIHYRRTVQIAPGRQADMVARAHEWAAIWKEAVGIDVRVSVVTTGTLGRLCFSEDYESMAAFEAADAKAFGSLNGVALMAKHNQEVRDGTSAHIPNTFHDEFWRDA
jgi:hypothetical protein